MPEKKIESLNKNKELAQFSKGLANPHRVKIIKILANLPGKQRCKVNSLVDKLPISQSTVSQHLKILKETGWIEGEIDGPSVCYCLKPKVFKQYKDLLSDLERGAKDE